MYYEEKKTAISFQAIISFQLSDPHFVFVVNSRKIKFSSSRHKTIEFHVK